MGCLSLLMLCMHGFESIAHVLPVLAGDGLLMEAAPRPVALPGWCTAFGLPQTCIVSAT